MKRIITLTGPTCSGKSTLAKELGKLGIPELVSVTTRPQREGEVEGEDYYFISEDRFDELESAGRMIQAVSLNGSRYGTADFEIDRHPGNTCVVVEPTGVTQFRAWASSQNDVRVMAVYVDNTLGTLAERLLCRFADDKQGKLEHYCLRMRNLISVEFNLWCDMVDYDHYIGRYDITNREKAAIRIKEVTDSESAFERVLAVAAGEQ